MSSIQQFQLCKYVTMQGDVAIPCERPCLGLYCLEHQRLMDEIDGLEKEIDRIVKGHQKK